MSYQPRLHRDPFQFYSEFDITPDWSTEFEGEWQGEVPSKTGDRYTLWLQQSLNKALKWKIAEDGKLGNGTRGALWTFRKREGLKQIGDLVCPADEKRLIAAGASPPPGGLVAGPQETTPPGLTIYEDIPLQVPLGQAKSMTGIFIPDKFCGGPEVDVIVYFHGFKLRSYKPEFAIDDYWKLPLFQLREKVNDSQKNVILVAPTLGPTNQPGSLVCTGGFDKFLDQVMTALTRAAIFKGKAPSIRNLVLACHSGSGWVMKAIILGSDSSVKKIKECWLLEPDNLGDSKGWKTWVQSSAGHKIFIHYSGSPGKSLCANLRGKAVPPGKVTCMTNVVAESTTGHDNVPMKHLSDRIKAATFLTGKSGCAVKLDKEFEFWNGETWDGESGSALDLLSPSELKAVKITSTFETGRAGGFGGLTGNFDGQGLSFGLLNFTIKAGSLIPLLKEFIEKHPTRFATAFDKDANRFREMVFATKPDPQNPRRRIRDVEAQMAFVNKMNAVPRKAKGNRIIEPWKTYFGRLENDPEFGKIQVKAVRRALDRARYWWSYFEFKTERGFAFMFDLVSSHGGAWLNAPKFQNRRRVLLRKMLAAKKAQVGREALTELEKMEVIANMIADVSLEEWREKVRIRKLWFVRGSGKVHGTLFDIKKDFGITDNAPDFTAKSSEFDFEWRDSEDAFESEVHQTIPLSRIDPEFETTTAVPSPKTISLFNTDLNAPYFGGNFNFRYNGGSNEAWITYNTYFSYTKSFPDEKKAILLANLRKAVAIWDSCAEVQVKDIAGNYNDRIRLRFKINIVKDRKNANKRTQVHPDGSRSVFFIDKDRETVMRDLNIFIGSSRNVLVHELGHVWGLKDEYKDRWISMKLSLGHVGPGSPLINDTTSIMNSGYDTDAGEFRTRYFQHFGRAILGAFWGLKKYMIPARMNGRVVSNSVIGRIALKKRDIAGNAPYTADQPEFNTVYTNIQITKRA